MSFVMGDGKLPLWPQAKIPQRTAEGHTFFLGDPREAKNRPHRLPVADPPLC